MYIENQPRHLTFHMKRWRLLVTSIVACSVGTTVWSAAQTPFTERRGEGQCFFLDKASSDEPPALDGQGFSKRTGTPRLDTAVNDILNRAAVSFSFDREEYPVFRFLMPGAGGGDGYARDGQSFEAGTRGLVAISANLLNEGAYLRPDRSGVPTEEMRLLAFEVIVGHEFAHVYQVRKNLTERLMVAEPTGKFIELHADFMAGWFMSQRHNLTTDILQFVANVLFERGDQAVGLSGHHGTKADRFSAVLQGYLRSAGTDNVDAAAANAIIYLRETTK